MITVTKKRCEHEACHPAIARPVCVSVPLPLRRRCQTRHSGDVAALHGGRSVHADRLETPRASLSDRVERISRNSRFKL